MMKKYIISLFVLMAATAIVAQERTTRYIYPDCNLGSEIMPPYQFHAALNYQMGRTFEKQLTLTSGAQFTLKAFGTTPCTVFFFNVQNPAVYSQSFKTAPVSGVTNLYQGVLNVTIPQSGSYFVLATASTQVNNKDVIITIGDSAYTSPISYNYIPFPQAANTEMCTFTTRSDYDTRLFIVQGTTSPKIVAYNDDNNIVSGYNWGTDSRIIETYNSSTNGVIVTSHGGGNEWETAYSDIYVGKILLQQRYNAMGFNHLVREDAFITSSYECQNNLDFTCLAWALGRWDDVIWPAPMCYTNDNFYIFNEFLNDNGFTTQGATENNSVIDMWCAELTDLQAINVRHFAVKAYSNPYALGYDWESKIGSKERIFHPRYALETIDTIVGDYYGSFVVHYRRMTAEELGVSSLSEIRHFYEIINYSTEERSYIQSQVDKIDFEIIKNFSILLGKLEKDFENYDPIRIYDFCKMQQYTEMLDYCKHNRSLLYRIMQLIENKNVIALKLLYDLTYKDNFDATKIAFCKYTRRSSGNQNHFIHRPVSSQSIVYSKALIYKERFGTLQAFTIDDKDIEIK